MSDADDPVAAWKRALIEELTAEDEAAGVPPESIAAANRVIENAAPTFVWVHRRERTRGSRKTTVEDHGAEPATPESVTRIVRKITGKAGGRPPGLTDIQDDAELAETIVEMDRDHVRMTRANLAARSGKTEPAIRGYLKVTGRTLEELVGAVLAQRTKSRS